MALNDADRARLERRLKEERVCTTRLLGQLVADQSAASEQDLAGDLTKVRYHLADLGSDAMEAELATSNAAQLSNELAAIDDALERLYRAPERFGICEATGAEIPPTDDALPADANRTPARAMPALFTPIRQDGWIFERACRWAAPPSLRRATPRVAPEPSRHTVRPSR